MSDDVVVDGGVVGPVKKPRKPRSPSKFVLMGVTEGGAYTSADRGKSRRECEEKALALPAGRYVVMCQHGDVFDVAEKTHAVIVRGKA